MAVPNMTGAQVGQLPGTINWDAFTIKYYGVEYAVAAGNTTKKWVWWRYNGGGVNSIIEAGDTIPTNLTDDDLVLFGNKNGLPVRTQSTSFVDGDLLVDGTILAKHIGADLAKVKSFQFGEMTGSTALIGELKIGSNITLNPQDGFRIILANSNGKIHFPTNGSPSVVDSALRTKDIVISGGLSLDGDTNYINGKLNLSKGVSTPKNPPVLSFNASEKSLTGGTKRDGHLTINSDVNFLYTLCLGTTNRELFIGKYTSAGVFVDYGPTSGALPEFYTSGFASDGTNFYATGVWADTSGLYIRLAKFSSTRALTSYVILKNENNVNFSTDYWEHGLSCDGTYLYLSIQTPSTTAHIYKYDLNGTYISRVALSGASGLKVYGAGYGAADVGTVKHWVTMSTSSTDTTAKVYCYNVDGTRDSQYDWIPQYPSNPYHISPLWITDRFVTSATPDPSSNITVASYGKTKIATSLDSAYSLYDSASPTHETMVSPLATITLPARKWLQVDTPTFAAKTAEDPDKKRIYVRPSSLASAFGLHSEILCTVGTSLIDGFISGGSAVSASNTFDSVSTATPGTLQSEAVKPSTTEPIWQFQGGGDSIFGSLRMNSSGQNIDSLLVRSTNVNVALASGYVSPSFTDVVVNGEGITWASNVATITRTGFYLLTIKCIISGGSGRRSIGIESFTTEALGSGTHQANNEVVIPASGNARYASSAAAYLAAGTKLRPMVWHSATGSTLQNVVGLAEFHVLKLP